MLREKRYHAYLLRLWQAKEDDQLVWRASLESPHTGSKRGFPTPEALFAFLTGQIKNNTAIIQQQEINQYHEEEA